MNVIGLDLSVRATGVAVPGRVFTIEPKRKGSERLAYIRKHVVHAARGMDLAVLESVVPGRNSLAFKALSEVGAVVKLALYDLGVPWVQMHPAHLKQFATERGNADKAAMRQAALRIVPWERFADDNCVDAWWLYTVGLQIVGRGLFVPSAKQREALERVEVSDVVRRRVRLAVGA